jgi:hypothetical protein
LRSVPLAVVEFAVITATCSAATEEAPAHVDCIQDAHLTSPTPMLPLLLPLLIPLLMPLLLPVLLPTSAWAAPRAGGAQAAAQAGLAHAINGRDETLDDVIASPTSIVPLALANPATLGSNGPPPNGSPPGGRGGGRIFNERIFNG